MGGVFLAFEGIDGCGKSTQIDLLVDWARRHDIDPLCVREPGGTQLGERLREVLLNHDTGAIAGSAEALIYAASRAELVARVVQPALDEARFVIADRYVDSSCAYQGAGRGLGVAEVRAANALATRGLMPTLTVLLRLDPAEAERRRTRDGGGADRIESAGNKFFTRVAVAYDELARQAGDRYVVVDATQSPEAVHEQIVRRVADELGAVGPTGQQVQA